MLRKLHIHNFTAFGEASLDFSTGLNVILGENGTGKSHLLKLGYALAYVFHSVATSDQRSKDVTGRQIADKLVNVFRPETLGRLVSRTQGRARSEVSAMLTGKKETSRFAFSFATNSKSAVSLTRVPLYVPEAAPIFLPTREMLSVFPGFAAACRNRELEFDQTYYDLALALESTPLRGKRPADWARLINLLETLMDGSVIVENGRFYLLARAFGKGRLEMHLVAEGIRKIAMITYLIINGGLRDKASLYWDEPETNLNPRLIRKVARMLMALAKHGVQVILATHSLFLLREIEILMAQRLFSGVPTRFFALARDDGGDVRVSAGKRPEDVDPIVSLDADLEQSDGYLKLG